MHTIRNAFGEFLRSQPFGWSRYNLAIIDTIFVAILGSVFLVICWKLAYSTATWDGTKKIHHGCALGYDYKFGDFLISKGIKIIWISFTLTIYVTCIRHFIRMSILFNFFFLSRLKIYFLLPEIHCKFMIDYIDDNLFSGHSLILDN